MVIREPMLNLAWSQLDRSMGQRWGVSIMNMTAEMAGA